MWKRFANSEDLHEYEKWLIRQFVNASPDIVLCPSSHCRRPVKYTGKKNDITCPFCAHFFCARCEGDAHSPATCQEVELWHEEKRFFTDEATERYVMVRRGNPLVSKVCGILLLLLFSAQFQKMSEMSHVYRKDTRMQPHEGALRLALVWNLLYHFVCSYAVHQL